MKNVQDAAVALSPLDEHDEKVFVIDGDGPYNSPKKPSSPVVLSPVTVCNTLNGHGYELLQTSNPSSPKRPADSRVDVLTAPLTTGLAAQEAALAGGTALGDPAPVEDPDDAPDSGLGLAPCSWDKAEVEDHSFVELREELKKAHEKLKLRDEEVVRLSRIRSEVEAELEELTASLFQEAHNMVRAANVKQVCAEKSLKESLMQAEVLSAEVVALKALVLTSTPSRPNHHLHPQIKDESSGHIFGNISSGIFKKHRRSPSHYNLNYGRENSPPYSPAKENKSSSVDSHDGKDAAFEVDPITHKEFLAWKQNPTSDKTDPFIARIYREDIDYCLDFSNAELGESVRLAIETGEVFIEAVSDRTKLTFPKKCSLLDAVRQCHYRLRVGSSNTWHPISHMCRNRIIAVCDLLNYLNYIQRGLVKSSVHDVYWEIVRLRKEMVLARLGLTLNS